MTDKNEADTPKLPVPVAEDDPQHPAATPAVPPLTNPTSTGIFSRFRVDLDTLMLKSLRARQSEMTAFLTEYGRTADAARNTAEKVALLQDLDAIREAARAEAADQREEAAHKRQVAALRRQEELANQQHRTNAAKYGERVFRETEPDLAEIRRQGLKAREHAAVKDIVAAETHVLSAEALRNNAHAERVQTMRDLADILAPPPEEQPKPASAGSEPPSIMEVIKQRLQEETVQGNTEAVSALQNLQARVARAYRSDGRLDESHARAILADEMEKVSQRGQHLHFQALCRVLDALGL